MVLSAIYFLDVKGKVLLSRDYRGDIPRETAERFMELLGDAEDEQRLVTPVLAHGGVTYVHIRHANLYIMALTRRNSDVMTILLFLHNMVRVFTEHFLALEEESLRDNFIVVYELLDEMMDFGHPQSTEGAVLREYITQKSFQLDARAGSRSPPVALTSAVSWRSEGIKYRKNEIFLDVVESVNLLVNSNGNVVQSEILGSVKVRSYLSGMPELRLGLNDRILFESVSRGTAAAAAAATTTMDGAAASMAAVGGIAGRGAASSKTVELEDVKFHQCVQLAKFDTERTISFIPPDGEFELMSYRLSPPAMKPPIWVECQIEKWTTSRIEYVVTVRSQLKKRVHANDVVVVIPVPEDADSPIFKV